MSEVVWQDERHKFVWLGAGDPADEDGVPSNQYMIVDEDVAYLLDPGGHGIFERVYRNVTSFIRPDQIKGLFLSHQDPDVAAGLDRWLKHAPQAQVIMSGLWMRFILHYPLAEVPALYPIPDDGDAIELPSGSLLKLIPAHYLHSAGNFHLYDQRARVLFSGDVGTAATFVDPHLPVVEKFDEHVYLMEGFHKRYMACNAAIRRYLEQLKGLQIDVICPQHGAMFKGDDVKRFLDWLGRLNVGVDA